MNAMRILSLAALVAILHAPAVYSAPPASDVTRNPSHVPGESLDNGLGELPASYTAAEFQRTSMHAAAAPRKASASYTTSKLQPVVMRSASTAVRVIGEKLDSGLGDLPPDYTGAEFQRKPTRAAVSGQRL